MKRLKITVDGTAYDVTVEEVGEDTPRASTPSPSAAPVSAPVSAPAVSTPPTVAASPGPAGHGQVVSPLAGTVMRFEVALGQAVNAGDPVLFLEAMKMESVIVAPVSGSVKSIDVAAGASVQEGEVLLTIG